jgi:hypothetical protein
MQKSNSNFPKWGNFNSLADIGNNPAFFDKATKFGTEVATVLNFDLKIVGT